MPYASDGPAGTRLTTSCGRLARRLTLSTAPPLQSQVQSRLPVGPRPPGRREKRCRVPVLRFPSRPRALSRIPDRVASVDAMLADWALRQSTLGAESRRLRAALDRLQEQMRAFERSRSRLAANLGRLEGV